MSDKAPRVVEADSALVRGYRQREFFPTPPWGARAGAEKLLEIDPGYWDVEDPCCGQGHMAAPIKPYFRTVATADVFDYGWDGLDRVSDFLSRSRASPSPDWYLMNPPFGATAEFVRLGLERAKRGVAVLGRQALMESVGRYDLFFGEQTRLTAYAPFFERVPMVIGRWDPKASTATAYAWFFWMKPELASGNAAPIVLPIAPGTKARLSQSEDVRRFAHRADAPLFDGGRA